MHVVDKPKVGISVEKILRDGGIGASLDLGGKGLQISLGGFRLRMNLRVSRHFNVKSVPGLGTDEGHQVAGVMELATHAKTTWQVTAQGHQTLHTHGL